MDATTTPSIPSKTNLVAQLEIDFPGITFTAGEQFMWSPKNQTVFYADHDDAQLLHELAHGLLEHSEYTRDVELITLERAAWDKALELAPHYHITIDEDQIEAHLDTYRDWLHARSTCPSCTAVGFQIKKATYQCPACGHQWRVNDARICGLKRYSIKKTAR